MNNPTRFIGAMAPVITIYKCYGLQEHTMMYYLNLNGKLDGRYTLEQLTKRIQEVMVDV